MGLREKEKDRFAALLTIALDGQDPQGECLSDGEFAALLDGRVDPRQRNNLLTHIDGCDSCFKIWVDWERGQPAKKSAWPRYAAGVGIAVSACLVLFIVHMWFPPDHDIHTLLDNGFKIVHQELPVQKKLPSLPWNREKTGYGFGPSVPNTLQNRAFGAGFWRGHIALFRENNSKTVPEFLLPPPNDEGVTWSENEAAPYFELGRWCSLVQAASLYPMILSEAFWQDQTRVFKEIQEKISQKEQQERDMVVAARLKAIGFQLKKVGENVSTRKHRKKIAGEINILIDLLSPQKPAETGS